MIGMIVMARESEYERSETGLKSEHESKRGMGSRSEASTGVGSTSAQFNTAWFWGEKV
jgi:hypothetical protein